MRAILSKVVAVSMIASAGLLVSACNTETATTVNNTTTEEVTVENTAVDTMSTVDGATGNGAVVEMNTTTETMNTTVTTNAM